MQTFVFNLRAILTERRFPRPVIAESKMHVIWGWGWGRGVGGDLGPLFCFAKLDITLHVNINKSVYMYENCVGGLYVYIKLNYIILKYNYFSRMIKLLSLKSLRITN